MNLDRWFSLEGRVAIVTGGTGVLGGAIARGLADAGAAVAVLGRRDQQATVVAEEISAKGGHALPVMADVLDSRQLERARQTVLSTWGTIDILVNAAGGNQAAAIAAGERSFFTVSVEAIEQVVRLNLIGSVLPAQVFGEVMAKHRSGVIINISSMAAQKPLTGVVGYAAAKAAVENYTKWLAVELAQRYGPAVRVNAIAPGFFVGEQNRHLLLRDDGSPTDRGLRILDHTPFQRFGQPNEVVGTAIWLASDAARFVTGVVIPVDGGFSAFAGV